MVNRNTTWDSRAVRCYFAARLDRVKWHGDQGSAICPFHSDSKPSLSMNAELGVFFCHGCGASGNLVTFEARLTGADPATARRNLRSLEIGR
jgi:DNA primase